MGPMSEEESQSMADRGESRSRQPQSSAFREFIGSGWAPRPTQLPERERVADFLTDRTLKAGAPFPGERLVIQPKVVDAGHHNRKFMRLTGMDVGEHQAVRLLADIDVWRATHDMQDVPLEEAAHEWLTDVFTPIVRAIPRELAGKLEPAQLYHEYLEHRWYMAQQAGHDIPRDEALASYITNILQSKRDEAVLLEPASERSSSFSAASHPDLW